MVADALVSVAVVAGGVIIAFTKWYWVDSLMSIIVAAVILKGTWGLLRDSLPTIFRRCSKRYKD